MPSNEPNEDCLMAGMMLAKTDGLATGAVVAKRDVFDGTFGGSSSSPELDWEDGSSRGRVPKFLSLAKNFCLGRVAPLAAVTDEAAGETGREGGAARVYGLDGGARRPPEGDEDSVSFCSTGRERV